MTTPLNSFSINITPGTSCLLDTNCLLRWSTRLDPQHEQVRRAVRALHTSGVPLYYVLQNEIECWNVLTRPTLKNGYGFSPAQAERRLQLMERIFQRLPEVDAVHTHWRRLVLQYDVSGVQVHDTRIAAMMLTHEIPYILTYNDSDFARFQREGITPITPILF